jgi:hypothetical protein
MYRGRAKSFCSMSATSTTTTTAASSCGGDSWNPPSRILEEGALEAAMEKKKTPI